MTIDENEFRAEDQDWLRQQQDALTFAAALKAHRLCEAWTQEAAAKKLGISKQMLNAYEKGHKLPSEKKAYEMAETLGMVPGMAVLLVINDRLRSDNLPLKVSLAS